MIYDPVNNPYVNNTLKLFDFYYKTRDKMPIVNINPFKRKSNKIQDYIPFNEAKELDEIEKEINNSYNLLSDNDSDKWFLYIRDFIYFLKVAEKVFMFDPTDLDVIINTNIDKSLEIYTMNIENDNYRIKFEFQDSSINVPGTCIDISDDDPLGFMKEPTPKDELNTVLFINIKFTRKFSDNSDEYKFIYSSSIPTTDFTDMYLLKIIKRYTSDVTIDTLKYIINNCIPEVTGIYRSYWRDIITPKYITIR